MVSALATTGGAIGAASFPFILETLLIGNPWQYVFVILAGIQLYVVVCGALLKTTKLPEEEE